MIILWTDALIFFLILVLILTVFSLRKKEQFIRPWKKVTHSRTAMVSLVILLCFMFIGLLDSVHFKPSDSKQNEIISILDYWANPLRLTQEKSYSAPFSAYLYSKELIITENQIRSWGYPRLEYGASHLSDIEAEKMSDILSKAILGLCKGAGITLLIFFAYHYLTKLVFFSSKAVNTVFATLFLINTISYMLVDLSSYYHVLGTDKVGEDVLYQAIKSIRTGLVIGSLTTLTQNITHLFGFNIT
jgi:peptide/nickel transport system permease protein